MTLAESVTWVAHPWSAPMLNTFVLKLGMFEDLSERLVRKAFTALGSMTMTVT